MSSLRSRRLALAPSLACAFLLMPAVARAAPPFYVRGAVGYEQSGDTTFRDLDCSSKSPPALFGCVDDLAGRPIGARGDFGESVALEVGIGAELGARARVELALVSRPGLELDATANFLGASDDQPVHADAESLAALVNVGVDLGRPGWRLQPFVTAGLGAARNEIGDVTYGFPALGLDAATIVQGGRHTGFAWTAGAGISFRLTEVLELELAGRYTDLGEVRTDSGLAVIRRSAETFDLDIAGTEADLDTAGVSLALRYRL